MTIYFVKGWCTFASNLKNVRHKIAVIHSLNTKRTLLAKALSCLSGYKFIRNRTVYEWRRMFGVEESQMHHFNNQFLVLSSSFVERITVEFDYPDFVSSGALFADVLSLQSKMDEKVVVCNSPVDTRMIRGLSDLTGRYAAQHYDSVIHVRSTDATEFDGLFTGFYEKHHIPYHLYDGAAEIEDIVNSIVREVEMPKVKSVSSAVYEAIGFCTFKN